MIKTNKNYQIRGYYYHEDITDLIKSFNNKTDAIKYFQSKSCKQRCMLYDEIELIEIIAQEILKEV